MAIQSASGKWCLEWEIDKAMRRAFGGKRAAFRKLGLDKHMSYIAYWHVFQRHVVPKERIELIEDVALEHPEVEEAIKELLVEQKEAALTDALLGGQEARFTTNDTHPKDDELLG